MRFQGSYPESIRKATMLVDYTGIVLYRIGGDVAAFPDNQGYLVSRGDGISFSRKEDRTWRINAVARWIDALDTNVRYVTSYLDENDIMYVIPVLFCGTLWEAEVESLSRNNAVIIDRRSGERFGPHDRD